jgi:hypothetical protein
VTEAMEVHAVPADALQQANSKVTRVAPEEIEKTFSSSSISKKLNIPPSLNGIVRS